MRRSLIFAACVLACFLAACGGVPTAPESAPAASARHDSALGREISLHALGLIGTGYRFGGKNPEAGLDCSGMVSYVFQQAGIRIAGSAADIARRGRPVDRRDLHPGDLVFFNTRGAPFTHVGVFIGDGRFVHAPSTRGRVRIDRMNAPYYAKRFHAARAYFD